MRLVYKNKATPLKKVGKYTYWFYEDEFVVTKQSYKNRDSIKEKIVAHLHEDDIIGIMKKNYMTFRGLDKIKKMGEENEFENI